MYQLKVRARKEVEQICAYLELYRPSAALRFLERTRETGLLLADMPLLGRVPQTARALRKNYRCFVMDDFLIYYKVTSYGVAIYRILHVRLESGGAQSPSPQPPVSAPPRTPRKPPRTDQ